MNITWTIIQREYLSRVKKKSFLVTTILIPVLITILMGVTVYLVSRSQEKQNILVQDESHFFQSQLKPNESYSIKYDMPLANEEKVDFLKRNQSDILVQIFPFQNAKPDSIHLFKEGGVSAVAENYIQNQLDNLFQIEQMKLAGINPLQIDSIHESELTLRSFDLKNNSETNSEIAMTIGYAMGIIIYLVIFIYGTGVMRGVMEEKTNRIAEVIISSVKPFQLMMGKIVGIALVGLTQLVIWMAIMFLLQIIAIPFLADVGTTSSMSSANLLVDSSLQNQQSEIKSILQIVQSQNWFMIIGLFVFYFLGGYFLYASMFAAVGSLVNEDPQEAQQMTIPITMPIILGFIIMTSSMKNPHSSLSVFGSLFPLTSPIVMMARIPYQVPWWQLALSMIFLVLGFLLMTWISSKIYRIGILRYGKKVNWSDLLQWIKQS